MLSEVRPKNGEKAREVKRPVTTLAIAAFAAFVSSSSAASAQSSTTYSSVRGGTIVNQIIGLPQQPASQPTLAVTGHGSVTRVPDRAVASIVVSAQGDTAEKALDAVTAIASPLQRSLERIASVHVSIANASENMFNGFDVAPSYSASVSFEVTVDDLARVGGVRAAVATSAGAQISNLRYDLRDRGAADSAALAAAIADARMQVDALTSKSNLRVTRTSQLNANVQVNQNRDSHSLRIDATAFASYEIATP